MRISIERIQKYLNEITQCVKNIKTIINQTQQPEERDILALKYLTIEVAEAMANILQHILAKEFGIAVKGYIDTVIKASENKIISEELFSRIKPFFDFRNALIHRYWQIDDSLFFDNLKEGYGDFMKFIEEIEGFLISCTEGDRGHTNNIDGSS